MLLNDEFLKLVRLPILNTWEAIAPDVSAIDDFVDNPSDNLELTLDSSYIEMYGGQDKKEGLAAFKAATAEHGYDMVFNFLLKNIRLGM